MRNYYRSIAKVIKAEFEACDIIQHSGRKGSSRERVLIKHLSKLLPENYGIGYGEIHESDGRKSGENDIILYNKSFTPLIYNDEATQIFPIEGVYGIIEVKSQLRLDEITKFMGKIHTLRKSPRVIRKEDMERLVRMEVIDEDGRTRGEYAPFGIMFALDGPTLENMAFKILEEYKKIDKEHMFSIVNAICIINRGVLTRVNYEKSSEGEREIITPLARAKGEMGLGIYESSDDWLSIFIAILYDVLSSIKMVQPPNFIKYIPINSLEVKSGSLKIGKIS